jgi:hypothetical protein
MHGRGLAGTPRFVLDDKLMNQTLELVVRALSPPAAPPKLTAKPLKPTKRAHA